MLWLPPSLRLLGFVLAVVALARPQEEGRLVRDESVEGIDIMIALDVSGSMDAADFRPNNRLFVAKQVLSEFISSRLHDRLGLVVFSGAAYTQSPLTLDYSLLRDVVSKLRTNVLEEGTAIGDAIATSLNRLRDSDAKSKVVVLITDGDNNAGTLSPLDAASMAEALDIPVYPILVGKGGKVPFPRGTNLFGQEVWDEVEMSVDPQLLQTMAQKTGGQFFRATDPQSLKKGLQDVLNAFEKSKFIESRGRRTYKETFHSFLIAASLCFAVEWLLRVTWLRVFP